MNTSLESGFVLMCSSTIAAGLYNLWLILMTSRYMIYWQLAL